MLRIDTQQDGVIHRGIVCYAQESKEKSKQVLQAFAKGCGAHIASTAVRELLPGTPVFYGIRDHYRHLWEQALRENRDYYFIDNSYFDAAREQQFRVTRNAIQHTGKGESDGKRFKALGIKIKPERTDGEKVVICPQSAEFMDVIANDPGWLPRVTTWIKREYGEQHVIVRTKQERRPLAKDLENAKLLVTWSSAAAVTARLEGIAVLCHSRCCATYSSDRERWAGVLSDNQFSLDELRNGFYWDRVSEPSRV